MKNAFIIMNYYSLLYLFFVVWQQVHMCPSALRSTRLLELLDAILNKGMKVIIFTTTVNDVCFIMEVSLFRCHIIHKDLLSPTSSFLIICLDQWNYRINQLQLLKKFNYFKIVSQCELVWKLKSPLFEIFEKIQLLN